MKKKKELNLGGGRGSRGGRQGNDQGGRTGGRGWDKERRRSEIISTLPENNRIEMDSGRQNFRGDRAGIEDPNEHRNHPGLQGSNQLDSSEGQFRVGKERGYYSMDLERSIRADQPDDNSLWYHPGAISSSGGPTRMDMGSDYRSGEPTRGIRGDRAVVMEDNRVSNHPNDLLDSAGRSFRLVSGSDAEPERAIRGHHSAANMRDNGYGYPQVLASSKQQDMDSGHHPDETGASRGDRGLIAEVATEDPILPSSWPKLHTARDRTEPQGKKRLRSYEGLPSDTGTAHVIFKTEGAHPHPTEEGAQLATNGGGRNYGKPHEWNSAPKLTQSRAEKKKKKMFQAGRHKKHKGRPGVDPNNAAEN